MNRFHKIGAALFVLIGLMVQASAHAFLDHSEPAVGSKTKTVPSEVQIWFTEAIEPAFSSIQVFDSSGKQIDKHDTHVDAKDKSLLRVSLPPQLKPGAYKVVWRVVSVDTHVTKGDFTFQVAP